MCCTIAFWIHLFLSHDGWCLFLLFLSIFYHLNYLLTIQVISHKVNVIFKIFNTGVDCCLCHIPPCKSLNSCGLSPWFFRQVPLSISLSTKLPWALSSITLALTCVEFELVEGRVRMNATSTIKQFCLSKRRFMALNTFVLDIFNLSLRIDSWKAPEKLRGDP